MNSHYFSQYLLSTEKLPAAEVIELLKRSVTLKSCLPIKAVRQGLVTPEQIADIWQLPESEFMEKVTEAGFLTEAQVGTLLQTVGGESLCFAQAMLDSGKHSLAEVSSLFAEFDKAEVQPVKAAIEKLAGIELENELPLYADYADLFVRSLIRFMDTPAIINTAEPYLPPEGSTHIVSQALLGDINLVTGLYAADEIFIELARRYSCEQISTVDDLAKDSVTEFLNVLNGLFAVDLAKREMEVDLDAPKVAEDQEPFGNKQMVVRIETGFGEFFMVMAVDEFVLA